MDYDINFSFGGEDSSYLTHSIHPYPAKFPPHLPKTILEKYARAGYTVLDPFCGSGTTMVEARILGMNAIGNDVNGLSTLLSEVKCTPLTDSQVCKVYEFVYMIEDAQKVWEHLRPVIDIKQVEGLDHWFQKNVSEELTFIVDRIGEITDDRVRNFLKISLSAIIVRVSNQESDTRFAAKDKGIKDGYVFRSFVARVKEYLPRIEELSTLVDDNKTFLELYNVDSRDLSCLYGRNVDIVITSPPYANTYDYYLYHKFRKRWLDIDVKYAQYNEIGSRREYSSLKRNAEKWYSDLMLCFTEINKVLKDEGLAFIVIGDSVINKELIKIDDIIREFAPALGFEVCNIISSNLSEHSLIFNPTFAQKGKKEHLIILKNKKNETRQDIL